MVTNLEYYKDEIKKKIKNGENFGCAICQAKNKNCKQCSADDGDDVLCNVVDWLLDEHVTPIRLKQWEKDLLEMHKGLKFENWGNLMDMKEKGYFQGVVNTKMKVDDILGVSEVEE